MEKEVDLRGLVCPEPVLRTKKLLDDQSVEKIQALVETEVSVNNLKRLAKSLRWHFESKNENEFFRVTLERSDIAASQAVSNTRETHVHGSATTLQNIGDKTGTVVFLAKDRMGEGDLDFSQTLLNLFLQTLLQSGHKPRAILLVNTGVKLLAPDAPTFKVLQDLKDDGCEVLACGLCVDFYGLKGKIPVEQITNMFAICEYLMSSERIVQP